jgi:predicted P-loop ATPase
MHKTITKVQWREVGAHGKPKPSLYNARVGIMAMKISCRHDMFRDITIVGYLGDNVTHEIKPLLGELTDATLLMLRNRFDSLFGFDPEDKHIRDAVRILALDYCFDPILDLLNKAQGEWDTVERLDTWVIKYLGCPDTPLNRAIGRKVLIAAARRAREPGCKFDNIVVLEGDEGWNKSTVIRTLAGDDFFSDQNIIGARDKEIQEQLSGVWMHEIADMTGMKKADVEHVKSFASRQVDRARPAYGRVVERKPRRSIDWATTNDEEYLQSQTGNRRFWPLACGGSIDIDALSRDRLQLLGEAAHYEAEGESLVLDEALWPEAKIEQERRRVRHPWEDILANIPESIDIEHRNGGTERKQIIRTTEETGTISREEVNSADLLTLVLRIPEGQQHKNHTMTLATCMKRNDWLRPASKRVSMGGQRHSSFYRYVARPMQRPAPPELVRF